MDLLHLLLLVFWIQIVTVVGTAASPPGDNGKAVLATVLDRLDNMQKKIDELELNEKILKEANAHLQARVGQLEAFLVSDDVTMDNENSNKDTSVPHDKVRTNIVAYTEKITVGSKEEGDSYGPAHHRHFSRTVLTEEPVAFCATLKANKQEAHIGINQPLIYDTLLTNLGGGFHLAHGLFTVPRSGIYLLSAAVMAYVNKEIHSTITVNGVGVANMYARGINGGLDQGTNVIVIQLNQVDDVAVENIETNDTSIWGDRYTSFSGYLLYPL